jgi:hypothetical protein
MPGHLLDLLLTLFALFGGAEPNSGTTGDNGSGLDPNGRP